MIKCEFHTHAKGDPREVLITYSYIDLFKLAKKFKYDFLALTFHDRVFYNKDVKYYAKKYGIITCPACEVTVENSHALVYGITEEERKKIKTIQDCKDYFCIAPHPFFPIGNCLQKKAIKNKNVFDAIEISSMHSPLLEKYNDMARLFAKKNKIPLVATSDMHFLWQFNKSFTYVDCEPNNYEDIFDAIRKNKVKIHQTKGSFLDVAKFIAMDIGKEAYKKITGRKDFCKENLIAE